MRKSEIDAYVYDLFGGRGASIDDGGWRRVECPACAEAGHSGRKNLAVNITSGYYKCWRCSVAGVSDELRDIGSALNAAVDAGMTERPKTFTLPEPWISADDAEQHPAAAKAIGYLRSRGYSSRTLREAGVGWSPQIKDRVIIPIWSRNGKLAGYSARLFAPDDAWSPKYKYPPGMSRDNVYNLDAFEERTSAPLFICEGVLDALAVWPDGIATLGKPTESQIGVIARTIVETRSTRTVILALDGDAWRENMIARVKLINAAYNAGIELRAGAIRFPAGQDIAAMLGGGARYKAAAVAARLRYLPANSLAQITADEVFF